jgi:cell division septation protein DedD
MRGAFEDEEFEPVRSGRDTELTLGPVMVLGLVVGLLLLCGLCFGLGYAMGRHGSANPAAASAQPDAGAQTTPDQASSSPSKPSATTQNLQQQHAPADEAQTADSETNPAANPQSDEPQTGSPYSGQPQVRPALPAQFNGAQSGSQVQPAPSQSSGLMVQIAAISHTEDARVLVDALRKRGYAVTARREPADGLIHVQIGPFTSRTQANTMCQKLLSDGYNAVVQQ